MYPFHGWRAAATNHHCKRFPTSTTLPIPHFPTSTTLSIPRSLLQTTPLSLALIQPSCPYLAKVTDPQRHFPTLTFPLSFAGGSPSRLARGGSGFVPELSEYNEFAAMGGGGTELSANELKAAAAANAAMQRSMQADAAGASLEQPVSPSVQVQMGVKVCSVRVR